MFLHIPKILGAPCFHFSSWNILLAPNHMHYRFVDQTMAWGSPHKCRFNGQISTVSCDSPKVPPESTFRILSLVSKFFDLASPYPTVNYFLYSAISVFLPLSRLPAFGKVAFSSTTVKQIVIFRIDNPYMQYNSWRCSLFCFPDRLKAGSSVGINTLCACSVAVGQRSARNCRVRHSDNQDARTVRVVIVCHCVREDVPVGPGRHTVLPTCPPGLRAAFPGLRAAFPGLRAAFPASEPPSRPPSRLPGLRAAFPASEPPSRPPSRLPGLRVAFPASELPSRPPSCLWKCKPAASTSPWVSRRSRRAGCPWGRLPSG
jgi:hypothetical protein